MLPEPILIGSATGRHSTHREQFRAALCEDNSVLTLPLETSSSSECTAAPRLGVTVYAKQYQEANFGLEAAADSSLAGITTRTARIYRQLHPSFDRLMPVRPQRRQGSIEFVAHPSCAANPAELHVLIDLTAAGGHQFADTVQPETTVFSLLERYYGEMKYDIEELVAKVGANLQHKALPDQLGATAGDVILVLPGPAPITWIPPPLTSLGPCADWLPLWQVPRSEIAPGVALWNCRKLQVLPTRFVPPALLHQRISQLAGISEHELSLRTFSRFGDLEVCGEPCHCIVVPIGPDGLSTFDDGEEPVTTARSLVVMDARPIGGPINVICTSAAIPTLQQCANAVQVQPSAGRQLRLQIVATLAPTSADDFRCFHVRLTSAKEPVHDIEDLVSIIEEGDNRPCSSDAHPISNYAAQPPPDDEASNDPASSEEEELLRFLQIMVLAFDHTPRVVEIALQMPSDVRSALNAVEFELEEEFFNCFSQLMPVFPQPAFSWGLVLALPSWAVEEPLSVFDLLAVDGRLFLVAMPPQFTRASLLHKAGYDPSDDIFVYPYGRATPMNDHETVPLQLQGLIHFRLTGGQRGAPTSLDQFLAAPDRWDISVVVPTGQPWHRATQVCVVLPDRTTGFMLLPERRQYFQEDLSQASGIPIHWLTVHSAKPPVHDALVDGLPCKGVAALCDHFPNVPSPPRRLGPKSFAVLLDCRPLLLGWQQWIVTDDDLLHSALALHYEVFAPSEHQIQIEGAELVGDHLQVRPGQVLLLQYVPVTPASHQPPPEGETALSDDWEFLPPASDDADTSRTSQDGASRSLRAPEPARDRSRSPRQGSQRSEPQDCSLMCKSTVFLLPLIQLSVLALVNLGPMLVIGVVFAATLPAVSASPLSAFSLPLAPFSRHVALPPEIPITIAAVLLRLLAPVACKLLNEPQPATGALRDGIAFLRYVGPRLGQGWRYSPPSDASIIVSDTDASSDEELLSVDAHIPVAICSPGYAMHAFALEVQLPTTPFELSVKLREVRNQEWELRLPILIPARPQPQLGLALFIALPSWAVSPPTQIAVCCLDTSKFDGRVFAAIGPEYVDRQHLLRMAQLPNNLGVAVYLSDDMVPLLDDVFCHVTHGTSVAFVPPEAAFPVPIFLEQTLIDAAAWTDSHVLPTPDADGNYVLLHDADTILYMTRFLAPTTYKDQIAACVGMRAQDVCLIPAQPRVMNAALDGLPCRTVLVVGTKPAADDAPVVWVIIDARDLFAGWYSYQTTSGIVSSPALLAAVHHTLPDGWQARLVDVSSDTESFEAQPGQVFQVVAVRVTPYASPEQATDPAQMPVDNDASASSGPTPNIDAQSTGSSHSAGPFNDTSAVGQTSASPGSSLLGPAASEPDMPRYHTGAFLVLAQECLPELVEVRYASGVSLQDALGLVSAARAPRDSARIPVLHAVHPQPRGTHALLIALPSWHLHGAHVVLDTRPVDGRLFAVHLVGNVSRGDLFRAAQLPDDPETEVFVGATPLPLAAGRFVSLLHGDLIYFTPAQAQYHVVTNLQDMLNSPEAWHSRFDPLGQLYVGPQHAVRVLGPHAAFTQVIAPDRQAFARQDIARRLNLPSDQVLLQQASFDLLDYCWLGIFAHAFVAAFSRSDRPADGRVYFLDMRPVFLGFSWSFCQGPLLDTSALCRRLAPRCPFGYRAALLQADLSVVPLGNAVAVAPGDILTVVFRPDGGGYTPVGHDFPPQPPASAGSAAGSAAPGAGSTYPVVPSQHRNGATGPTIAAETGSTQHLCTYWEAILLICDMWIASHFRCAVLAGAWLDTSVTLLALIPHCLEHLLAAICLIKDRSVCAFISFCAIFRCNAEPSHAFVPSQPRSLPTARAVVRPSFVKLFLVCVQVHAMQAVQLPPISCFEAPDAFDDMPGHRQFRAPPAFPDGNLPNLRRLPTPARTWRPPPPVEEDFQDFFADMRTLLSLSVEQPDSTALYAAATLIETLSASVGSSSAISQPRQVQLDRLLPEPARVTGLRRYLAACANHVLWHEPLFIGQTPLGFSLEAARDLVDTTCLLFSWQEVSHVSPFLRGVSMQTLLDFAFRLLDLATEAGCDPCSHVWCYTDGSFTETRHGCPNRLGWACIFIHPHSGTVRCACGAVPEDLGYSASGGSAYDAECCALLAGAILSHHAFSADTVHFLSDCQSALGVVSGQYGYAPGTLAEAACNAHALRRQLGNVDTYSYVQGHSANLGNDIADALSKVGARACTSLGLDLPAAESKMWFGNGAAVLSWVGVALRSALGHKDMPPLNSNHLGDDCFHAGLSPLQMLAPFVPPNVANSDQLGTSSPDAVAAQLHFRIATFNALSLISADDDSHARTIRGTGTCKKSRTPGRAVILAKQLEAAGIQIAFIQEARSAQGSSQAGPYHRFSSGALRGQWGTEIWFRAGSTLFRREAPHTSGVIKRSAIIDLYADPRRLLARLTVDGQSFLLVCLHGPNRATEAADIESWWDRTLELIHTHLRKDVLIVAGDMNASIGSVVSDHFDGVAAETEDPAGAKLHELALRFQMWGPATFFDHHRGASHTYVQKKNGRLCRPDFVLIPLAWRTGLVNSWTDPAIHAAHPNQDHIAACLEVSLTVQVRSAPHPAGRRIPASLVTNPACREKIQQVLLHAPAVDWQVSSHAHAAIITKHIQDGLQEISKSVPKQPRRHYLQEDTWALHHTVASIRRALHQRQHHLQRHLLAAAFAVWHRNQTSLEQAFSLNRWVKQMRVLLAAGIWQLEHYTRVLRAFCRRDRTAYLERLAEQFARGASHEVYDAYHKLLCHKRKKPFRLEPLPGVRDDQGNVCSDPEGLSRRWRQHFSALEAGKDTTPHQLAISALEASSNLCLSWPSPPDTSVVPSATNVQRVLASTKASKAPGFDGIPPELCKFFSEEVCNLILPLIHKHVWRGNEPFGWKGGCSVFFYKGKGSLQDCASFRSVLLLSSLAKAVHQSLRPPLKAFFEAKSPELQIGGRKGCSVSFGSHLIRSVTRIACQQGQACFTVFADIASAFYGTITELVATLSASDQPLSAAALQDRLRLSTEDVQDLADRLAAPSAMKHQGASEWLEAITAAMCQGELVHDAE